VTSFTSRSTHSRSHCRATSPTRLAPSRAFELSGSTFVKPRRRPIATTRRTVRQFARRKKHQRAFTRVPGGAILTTGLRGRSASAAASGLDSAGGSADRPARSFFPIRRNLAHPATQAVGKPCFRPPLFFLSGAGRAVRREERPDDAKRMRRQPHIHANSLQGLPIAVLSVFKGLALVIPAKAGIQRRRAPAVHGRPRARA